MSRSCALALALTFAAALAAQAMVGPAFVANAVPLALAAIVVAGLPHGTLDIKAIADSNRLGRRETLAVLALYLAFAAAMGAVWFLSPVAALAVFLFVGVVHFSEDFAVDGPPVLSATVPAALFCAGAVSHGGAYDGIFVAMTGSSEARVVTDALAALAPLAHGGLFATLVLLVRDGGRARALAAGIAVAGMWLFHPVVGFALYFALYHSPQHIAEVFETVRGTRKRLAVEAGATFALSVGLIALIGRTIEPGAFSAIGSGIFIALSVLTVPHMMVPRVIDAAARRNRAALAT